MIVIPSSIYSVYTLLELGLNITRAYYCRVSILRGELASVNSPAFVRWCILNYEYLVTISSGRGIEKRSCSQAQISSNKHLLSLWDGI